MKHPTHAVRMVNNFDGQMDILTVFAFKIDDRFYDFDTHTLLLVYEGDKILKVWELN